MTLRTTWLDDDADRREAVGVAARAMRDNPMSLALSDDPLVRLDILCGMFTDTLTKGTVAGARTRECVLGVAAVGGPGRCVRYMLPAEQRVRSDPDPDASPLDRLVRVASVMADHDLLEDHWHVGPVGVEPGFQRSGIGRAAMGLLCDHFDEQGQLAWLETDKPENVPFYASLGFELVERMSVLGFAFAFMRRQPR